MSRFFAMLRAQKLLNSAMFHGVIHKITLAQFFETRCILQSVRQVKCFVEIISIFF